MKDGFVKVAAFNPAVVVADCAYNIEQIAQGMEDASSRGVHLLTLPELCLTAYSCDDLFSQDMLLEAAIDGVLELAARTKDKNMLVAVGLPLLHNQKLYNVAAVLCGGRVLGFVPKTNLPTYDEFYELRQFAPAPAALQTVTVRGEHYPFGTNLLFQCAGLPALTVAVEICEDLFVTSSPSARHAAAGALVILNLSASSERVGKAAFRRKAVEIQSAKEICGYVYASAGRTESTTDVVFSGHNLIAENGVILAESVPFGDGYAESDIDICRLAAERARVSSFVSLENEQYKTVSFDLAVLDTILTRRFRQHPFVPDDKADRAIRCNDIFNIQCAALQKRLEHTRAAKAVIGISGGLDSTLALLVACRTMRAMGRPATDIIGISMPCFGTSTRTKTNAQLLCGCMGVHYREIDITASVTQHFADIGHSGTETDTAYENAQARERTQVLMDIANMENGMVIGTGDLSELALGWCTYNGDHMSMYAVNCGVPKTLVRHLVQFAADESDETLRAVLCDVLNTPVSPELVPGSGEEPAQRTEDIIGPYELHDFFLYHMIRWGYPPVKLVRIAALAFDGIYSRAEIIRWLKLFLQRFFASQFKRTCVPNGPKIGSIGLSPRGDWRMPSDASARLWLDQLKELE